MIGIIRYTCIFIFLLAYCSIATAGSVRYNRMHFHGVIKARACNIFMAGGEQQIDMGELIEKQLEYNNKTLSERFSIHLDHCVFDVNSKNDTPWQYFRVTVDSVDADNFSEPDANAGNIVLQLLNKGMRASNKGEKVGNYTKVSNTDMRLDYALSFKERNVFGPADNLPLIPSSFIVEYKVSYF